MKKITIILLACIMLFSGCKSSDVKNFGAEYSAEDKYMAMLPDGISVPMEYNDILELKGKSQYRVYEEKFNYSGQLFYDETFFNKQCVLGFSFEKDNLKELAYIYECENEKAMLNAAEDFCDYLENCYGEPFSKEKDKHRFSSKWNFDDYVVILNTDYNGNRVKCILRLNDEFAGVENEIIDYNYTTTTTAYEWKLNTNSTGYDWISVDEIEKEVWCSNSIASWRLMGYDIPNGVTTKSMVKAIDNLYEDETYLKYDLVTTSEMFAIANNIY